MSNRSKKNLFVKVLLSLVSLLLFTGCLDMFTYITVDEEENIIVDFKLSVDKNLALMMGEDLEGVFPSDVEPLHDKKTGMSGEFNLIDTATDYGMYVKMKGKINAIERSLEEYPDLAFFLPTKEGNTHSLTLRLDDFDLEDFEANEMGMLLDGLKYKLMISKTYIQTMSSVYIENTYGDTTNITYYDLHDFYLIEVPLKSLSEENMLRIVE